MSYDLVIDALSPEIGIALLEDKQLIELNKEKTNIQFAVGDIYLGKIKKIMPGLNAAFVDVGYEKDAFLHYQDLGPQFNSLNKYTKLAISRKGKIIPLQKFKNESDLDKNGKIADVLVSGHSVIVQVAKEPISTKGPRLTSEISIAGRNLVLIPFSDKVSVSQKIESVEERNRLKTLILSIKPKGYGVIVRTVAELKKVAVLDAELRGLVKKWEVAFEQLKGSIPPKLAISEVDRTVAILRDLLSVSFNNIYINDLTLYAEVKDYISTIAPEKEKIVKLYAGKEPIYDHFGLTKQIKSLFGKTVSFKNGAYLIIEHTEALHVIDVNSGNRAKSANDQETTAHEVNLAAAEEIARQLRLRDMGGIIVVDFIDMQQQEHKQMLYDKMREVMANDRAKHNILPLSKFGIMQITRQRVRPEMNIDVVEKCPTCKGSGEITSSILITEEIENRMAFLIEKNNLKKIKIQLHPFIATFIKNGLVSLRLKWMLKYNCLIGIQPRYDMGLLEFKFTDNLNNDIID